MKKTFTSVLAFMILVSLCACGNDSSKSTVSETSSTVSEETQESVEVTVDDTQSAFYVIETDSFRATLSNLVFEGEDSCTYDVMIANLTDEVIEFQFPEDGILNPGESIMFKEESWPIVDTDKYGLSGILFEFDCSTDYGSFYLYYDRDTNEVLRIESMDRSLVSRVFEYSNELVSMEVYYNSFDKDFDYVDTNFVVTNISSYALYDSNGEILEPGQSMEKQCFAKFKDEDTLWFSPSFNAYNASRLPVLNMTYDVQINYKDLSVIACTEIEDFVDLEQAQNTDIYRVNKFKRVDVKVVSTPYYTLTVKEIHAEEQNDGTILVTLVGEMTNNYGMFFMLGTDVWKMGDEIKYASGYPGYFGTENPERIECTYTVSDESDLSGTASFVVEGGWDPRSTEVLFEEETHNVSVNWTDGNPSFD